jgi:hypothetical protein
MIEDLTLEPDTEGREPPGPALIVPGANPQLEISEQMYRCARRDFPGSGEVIFVDVDEQTGEEMFFYAERWQRLLTWPRLPTLAEAEQWKARQEARAATALYYALQPKGEPEPWD